MVSHHQVLATVCDSNRCGDFRWYPTTRCSLLCVTVTGVVISNGILAKLQKHHCFHGDVSLRQQKNSSAFIYGGTEKFKC